MPPRPAPGCWTGWRHEQANPTFYGAASTRNAARDRLVSGFPLPEVNMTAPVGPDDFTEQSSWPPTRVKARIDRLNLYEEMWRGDITRFVKDPTAANLVMNYFRRVPTVITALLLSKDPGVPQDQMITTQMMLAEGSINGFRSGRAYITMVDGEIASPETSKVYDGVNGEIYVLETSTTVDSQSDLDNRLAVTAITSDGGSLKYTYEWTGGTIQGLLEGPEVGSGSWRLIDRPPRYNRFGTSMYDDLGPPLVGLALRLSGNERVIEKNLHPLTLMPLALADFSAFGSEGLPRRLLWARRGGPRQLPEGVHRGAGRGPDAHPRQHVGADETGVGWRRDDGRRRDDPRPPQGSLRHDRPTGGGARWDLRGSQRRCA